MNKKLSFPLRISSVKVIWSYLLKETLMENIIFEQWEQTKPAFPVPVHQKFFS